MVINIRAAVSYTDTGFLATDMMNWDSGEPVVDDNAEYVKGLYGTLAGPTLSFVYQDGAGDVTYVSKDDISVTLNGHDASGYVEYISHENVPGMYDVRCSKLGDYTFSYNGSDITLHIDYPNVGFYSAGTKSEDNYLRTFKAVDNNKEFYIILSAPVDYTTTLRDNPFTVFDWETGSEITGSQIDDYLTCTQIDAVTYKVTVKKTGFDFMVGCQVTSNTDPVDTWSEDTSIEVADAVQGLVIKDWIEYDEATDSLYIPDQAEFSKNVSGELGVKTVYLAYLASEGNSTWTDLSVDDISVTYNGQPATDMVTMSQNTNNSKFIDLKFKKTGTYTLSYVISPGVTTSATIDVGYPTLGFYKTAQLSDDGYIDSTFEYTSGNNDAFYMIINTNGADITSPDVNVNYYYEDAVETELVSQDAHNIIYKVTVKDALSSEFYITGSCMCAYPNEQPWKYEHELEIKATNFSGRQTFTDGETHMGYSGCYITKEEFDAGMVFYNNNTPVYWVHADSVQGVIDKLSAVANGEEILYQQIDYDKPNTSVDTKNSKITNTGYTYITVSHFGDINLEDQYVSSSGNMKGILFSSGRDYAYSIHAKEDGFYIEDAIFNLSGLRSIITNKGLNPDDIIPASLNSEAYVSLYRNKLYYVQKVDSNGHVYYTMDINRPVTYASGEESKEADMMSYLNYDSENREIGKHFVFPKMHVNVYCDMKFTGTYEKLSVGFKEGKDFTVAIYDEMDGSCLSTYTMADLGGAKTKSVQATVGYVGDNNTHVVENIEVWLYEINSSTNTTGTYGSMIGIAEPPEPNSLQELTQEQRDAIEQNKKLDISVEAEEKSAKDIDDNVKKAITDEVNDAKFSQYIFMDFNVYASVEGVVRNGKTVKTQITELKAPMEITMEIPEHARKQGRKYIIIRHHIDKNGRSFTDIIEGRVSADGKYITFNTDCFSTYALAYESSGVDKTTIDMSKVSWDYGKSLTYDGTQKKVQLINLPEGVTVKYTGNVATEAGKYTAKAEFIYDESKYVLSDTSKIITLEWEITQAETKKNNVSGGPNTGDLATVMMCMMMLASVTGILCIGKKIKNKQ